MQEIWQLIMKWLETWDAGKHQMLVQDTVITYEEYLYASRRSEAKDQEER